MDQLDLLKKDWKKQESSLPKLSKTDLSKLIHKKSSSIVKWIFIISVLEFIIPMLFSVFTNYEKPLKSYEDIGLTNFYKGLYIFSYIVILYFIYRFYKNYRSISANSNPKVLMQNIIKTRKVVKYYIWFNLAIVPIALSYMLYKIFNSSQFLEQIPPNTNMVVLWLLAAVLILVSLGIVWLFYQLIYGILLNKLKRNFKELVENGKELQDS